MSGLFQPALPWLVGAAWGVLAAIPFVVGARRSRVHVRITPLRTEGERAARPPFGRSLLESVAPRLLHSAPGRMVTTWRDRRRTAREDAVLAGELPVALDLLGVAVEAGCTPYVAVDLAGRWAPPAIAARLTDVRRACALGASFGDALDDLGTRLPRLRALSDALLTSDRIGAPVGPALARLAREQRSELRRRAETHARRVPVRLLFPLVFVVLPAFALLTVIPTLLAGFSRL